MCLKGSKSEQKLKDEYPNPHQRKRELARLFGVEDRMFVEVQGYARIHAIADEDLDREYAEQASAVHFVRFEFTPAQRQAVRAGAAVKLGCGHTHDPAQVLISPETLASLAGDLHACSAADITMTPLWPLWPFPPVAADPA